MTHLASTFRKLGRSQISVITDAFDDGRIRVCWEALLGKDVEALLQEQMAPSSTRVSAATIIMEVLMGHNAFGVVKVSVGGCF